MAPDDSPLDGAIRNLSRVGIGGALVGVPVVLLLAFDAPSWASVVYLLAAILVLGVFVVRDRVR